MTYGGNVPTVATSVVRIVELTVRWVYAQTARTSSVPNAVTVNQDARPAGKNAVVRRHSDIFYKICLKKHIKIRTG